MILVHKLKGDPLWVNPDLIAFLESNHDTVLTFLDGRHVVISESPDAVAAGVQHYRAGVLALAFGLHADGPTRGNLRLVPGTDEA